MNYDSSFFAYVNSGSLISAERLLPFLLNSVEISSVLDVGCGQGAWLSVWRKLGVEDIVGVDGDYVDREKLIIPETLFKPFDLNIVTKKLEKIGIQKPARDTREPIEEDPLQTTTEQIFGDISAILNI